MEELTGSSLLVPPQPAAGDQQVQRRNRFDWIVIAFVAGAVALGKTLRPPSRWGATQAQVDYRLGLVKRGFFGEFVTRPLHLEHYERFALVSFALLALLLGLLVLYTVRSGLTRRVLAMEVLALFSSSYAVTYLAHTVGYLDIPLAAMTVLLLLVRDPNMRFLLSIPAVVAGVMTHEAYLVLFLPVLALSFLLQAAGDHRRRLRAGLIRAAVLAMIAGALAVVMARRPSLTVAQTQAFKAQLTQRLDFTPEPTFFLVMAWSATDNLNVMHTLFHKPGWWKTQVVSVFTIAPTVTLLLFIALRVWRAGGPRIRGSSVVLVAAALSPLLMHLLGFDSGRWNSLVILNSFLVLLSICYYTEGRAITLSSRVRHIVILVAMLNMASGMLLIESVMIRPFPFLPEGHVSLKALLPRNWKP